MSCMNYNFDPGPKGLSFCRSFGLCCVKPRIWVHLNFLTFDIVDAIWLVKSHFMIWEFLKM